MLVWLRQTSRFQRIALILLILTVAWWLLSFVGGQSTPTTFVVIASFIAFSAFRKQLLWRVRNRLLLTFFLFGVVPLLLIGLMLTFSIELALGQFAVQKARQGIDAQLKLLQTAAANSVPPNIARANVTPPFSAINFQSLIERQGNYYLAAQDHAGVLSVPLDDETMKSITAGAVTLGAIVSKDEDIDVHLEPSGFKVLTGPKRDTREVETVSLPPSKGFWDVPVAGVLRQSVIGGEDVAIVALARVSTLTSGFGSGPMAQVVIAVLLIVGGFLLIVEIVSLISSIRLTRSITRSVHDLYQGTQYVAAGDFSHQIPVRGHHQLSDLAASFNSMTSKIQHYIGEMRKKEKLESEIEIARQVQARLFPRSVPQLKTLQMAGVCQPGRFVSGDYYDFVKLDDKHTAIALGDVSGKGVSAALLMASIQSALHTQLRFSGTDQNPSLSTAALMALISQQLYESTPPEKYATFFCSVYDDETGVLHYTNCGHLRPILIRLGKPETLPGDGMVVGLLPKVKYDQHEFQMLPGDLIAIFSDGVSEAENSAGDQFSEDRLAELLAKNTDKPLDEIIKTVTAAIQKWVHDPEGQDDTTIVLMRRIA
jgi:sigma-B regulation protein RsbU (phosphoserine phosphatase)